MLMLLLVVDRKLGFTGTQKGMTLAQEKGVRSLMVGHPKELHHGDCIGADKVADWIATSYGVPVVVHPPVNESKRAFCHSSGVDGTRQVLKPKPYLERNRDIVDACDVLIAAPKEMTDQLRSGTWSTVRYAKKQGKQVILVFPDGTMQVVDKESVSA